MTDGKSTKEAVSLKIYESAEDYLEKILMLTERNGEVRSNRHRYRDGCYQAEREHCNEKICVRPVIFRWMVLGYITLEPPGLEIAPDLWPPQKLTRFFVALGVDPAVASHDCLQDRA